MVVGLFAIPMPAARAQNEEPGSQATQNPPDKEEARPEPEQPASPRELAPNIVDDLRGRVKDRTRIPDWYQNNPTEEAKAYCQALIAANQTSAQAFANSARHDVTYVRLFEEPEKYRGQVIHSEGRVIRVWRLDPPGYVKGDVFGINDLYEAWIFDREIHGANPVCVVFTQLPSGVPVKEKMDIPVAFDAYFFKRYRYPSKDNDGKDILRDCPLFIGHTLTVRKVSAAASDGVVRSISSFTTSLVIAVLLMFLGTVGLAVLLSWWYRRGDRRIHRLLADANAPSFPEPEATALEGDNGHAERRTDCQSILRTETEGGSPANNGHTNGDGLSEYPDMPNRLRRGNINID
jgi:hypothetical protein